MDFALGAGVERGACHGPCANPISCRFLGGGGMARELSYESIFQWCVASTRAGTTHNIKPSSTLVAHDFSSAFPLLTGGAYIRKRQFVPRVIK